MSKRRQADIWFEALEEIGEKPIMYYCIHSSSDQKVDWIELAHKDHDGFGGIFQLAADIDQQIVIDYKLVDRKLSLMQKLKALKLYLHEGNIRKTLWKNFDPHASGQNIKRIFDLGLGDLEKLQNAARKEKASFHIFMLREFDQLIAQIFLNPGQTRWWMIPINTRSMADKYSRSNHSSYISLQLTDLTSPRNLQEMLIQKLKTGAYWVPWFFMNAFSFLGKKIIKKILKNYEDNQHSWAGIFTYLDYSFTNDVAGHFKEKRIVGVAPVTKAHSIACDIIKTNNGVSVCLHFHAGHDSILVEKFLARFKTFLYS